MKLNLLLIALVVTSNISYADTTLIFQIPGPSAEKQSLTYYIKNGHLRIQEAGNKKTNIFDHNKQEFTSYDQTTGNISRINLDIVNQHVERLNKQRLEKLEAVENKLQKELESRKDDKKEIAEVLMNKLKYPEFYGDHTFLTSKKTSTRKQINGIECQIHNIHQHENLVRQLCMASIDNLKMNKSDYQTLRSFYKFNYASQSKIMIASGKTSFTYVDFEEHDMHGVPVEIMVFTKKGSQQQQIMHEINHTPIDDSIFKIKTP